MDQVPFVSSPKRRLNDALEKAKQLVATGFEDAREPTMLIPTPALSLQNDWENVANDEDEDDVDDSEGDMDEMEDNDDDDEDAYMASQDAADLPEAPPADASSPHTALTSIAGNEELKPSTATVTRSPALVLRSAIPGAQDTLFNMDAWLTYLNDVDTEDGLPPPKGDRRTPKVDLRTEVYEHKKKDLRFKFTENAITFNVVRIAMKRAGLALTSTSSWNAIWGKPLTPEGYKGLGLFQKVNHFPGTWALGRKDRLAKNIARMRRQVGKALDFDFHPESYHLPADNKLLQHEMARVAQSSGSSSSGLANAWIVKPPASSCGRGIRVITKTSQLPKKKKALVQRYLGDPFLINGFKFDLRLYVLCTSFDPLRLYLYEDGLVRFSTQKYRKDPKFAKSRFMHLTNYSVQKKSKNFVKNEDADADDEGTKWSLKALRRWFKQRGIDDTQLWEDIRDVIIKTVMAVENEVQSKMKQVLSHPHRVQCYELWGFDILLDSNLKPWLIEVNTGPSLSSGSPLDKRIKTGVVSDTVNLVGFTPYDKKQYAKDVEDERQERLLGIASSRSRRSAAAAKGASGATARRSRSVSSNSSHFSLSGSGSSGANLLGGVPYKPTLHELETSDDRSMFLKLSVDDRTVLELTEGEYRRRGRFQRIFPSPESSKYLPYFETRRYYNHLVDRICRSFRKEGIYAPMQYSELVQAFHLHPEKIGPSVPTSTRRTLSVPGRLNTRSSSRSSTVNSARSHNRSTSSVGSTASSGGRASSSRKKAARKQLSVATRLSSGDSSTGHIRRTASSHSTTSGNTLDLVSGAFSDHAHGGNTAASIQQPAVIQRLVNRVATVQLGEESRASEEPLETSNSAQRTATEMQKRLMEEYADIRGRRLGSGEESRSLGPSGSGFPPRTRTASSSTRISVSSASDAPRPSTSSLATAYTTYGLNGAAMMVRSSASRGSPRGLLHTTGNAIAGTGSAARQGRSGGSGSTAATSSRSYMYGQSRSHSYSQSGSGSGAMSGSGVAGHRSHSHSEIQSSGNSHPDALHASDYNDTSNAGGATHRAPLPPASAHSAQTRRFGHSARSVFATSGQR